MTAIVSAGVFLPDVAQRIPVLAIPNLDPGRGRIELEVPPGLTVLEIVRLALPMLKDAEHDLVRVVLKPPLGEAQGRAWPVLRENWHRVRPTPLSRVIIRVVPEKGVFGQILSIVVSVAALALGQFYLGPLLAGSLGFTAGSAGFNAVVGLTTAGLALAGNLLINALIPQPSPGKKQSPTYSIEGWKNVFQPGMPVPALLGEHRQAPVHCAMPYSKIENDAMVSVALLTLGIGPYEFDIDDIKIGPTPITKLMAALEALDDDEEDFDGQSGLKLELRKGLPSDRAITLYEGQRYEERFDIHLLKITDGINEEGFPEEPATKVTGTDIIKFKIIVFFPGGLVEFDDKGKRKTENAQIQVRYRPLGEPTWTVPPVLFYKERKNKPFFRESEYDIVGDRGPAYEVELTRLDDEGEGSNFQSACHWIALQSIRPEYPLNFPLSLALISVEARASKLVNGIVDELTVQNRRVAPDWNGSAWVTQATRSPAAAARFIMQGPATLSPLISAEINLPALQELAEFCDAKSLNYDFVHDSEASWWEVLNQALAAGRALPLDTGEEWTVVIDKPRTKAIDHLTPLETWGFRWEAPTPRLPDAFRIPFRDATDGYEQAERIVPRPGFVGAPVRFEELQFPGVTDPTQVYLAGYRRWLEIEHRLDRYFCEEGVKNLVLTRADMALYSHDILMPGTVHGWVREIIAEERKVLLDVAVHMESGSGYAARFRFLKSKEQETDNDYPAATMLRSVATMPGDHRLITLSGGGPMPPVGALAEFGPTGQETIEVIPKLIESGDDFTARLELMDHAPQIDEELDAVVVPDWDRRIGEIIDLTIAVPAVPRIAAIISGEDANDEDFPNLVLVYLQKGIGSSPVTTYEVRHRLNGTTPWTVEPAVSVSVAVVRIEIYDAGDEIEVEARADNTAGPSDWTDPPEEHVVAGNDDTMPEIATFDAERNVATNLWAYEWTVTDPDDLAAGVRLRYRSGTWSDWEDLNPLFTQTVTVSPWDSSKPVAVDTYTFGAIAVLDDGTEVGDAIVITVPP